jgi:hypothetical protein
MSTKAVIKIATHPRGHTATEDTGDRMEIEAEVVGPWAMFRDPWYDGEYWNLTHVPTGLCGGYRSKKSNLRRLMAAMNALPVDWSAIKTYGEAKAAIETIPAELRKATARTALDFKVSE